MLHQPSTQNAQLSGLAGGFTVGFGIWTVVTATRQTKLCKNPRRSVFIYMVWGEITVNLLMLIVAWLTVNKFIAENLLFFILITSLWVFEIHLYYQIIINRCAVVAKDQLFIKKLKIGTIILIAIINVSVFIIWIPANLTPPPIPALVNVSKIWDRISKVILLLLDMALNWYFLSVVRQQLVKHHGLVKYKPLVFSNARLMIVSVLMDVLLIGLESLSLSQGSVVFETFHPLVYIVKLHIELSMAALIAKVSKTSVEDRLQDFYNSNITCPPCERSDSDPTKIAPVILRSGTNSSNDTTDSNNSNNNKPSRIYQTNAIAVAVEGLSVAALVGGDLDLEKGIAAILVEREMLTGLNCEGGREVKEINVDVKKELGTSVLLVERDKFD